MTKIDLYLYNLYYKHLGFKRWEACSMTTKIVGTYSSCSGSMKLTCVNAALARHMYTTLLEVP